jgi:hypothetical protein
VDVIRLSCTGNHRDGERLRVSRFGVFVAELPTVEELASLVDLAEMEEVLAIPRLPRIRRPLRS